MEQAKELLDRTRRIETKLTRLLNGEGDHGVTNIEYDLTLTSGRWRLVLPTTNITVMQLATLLGNEPSLVPGDELDVYDNQRYVLTLVIS